MCWRVHTGVTWCTTQGLYVTQAICCWAPAGVAWSFLKANRGNVLLLITFYSMSTAGVIGSAMARHRLQVRRRSWVKGSGVEVH
jgi:hypothetical protein